MNFSFLKEKGSKYIIWIILGVLVLIVAIPVQEESQSEAPLVSEEVTQGELESKLEKVLSSMEGVGDVAVMITVKESSSDLFSDTKEEGEVLGVVVVAEGAGKTEVNAKILDTVKALFGIEVHKISIVKMQSQEDGK